MRVRTTPAEVIGHAHEFVPLLARSLARLRLQTVLDVQELVVEMLDG